MARSALKEAKRIVGGGKHKKIPSNLFNAVQYDTRLNVFLLGRKIAMPLSENSLGYQSELHALAEVM